MTFYVICLVVTSFIATSIKFSAAESHDVVFVSVLFRHGDRTPTKLYSNDPNPRHAFDPPGLGMLTQEGKDREYQLGLVLRNRYKDFLGRNNEMPERVKARSTDTRRTKKSMELVLRALYHPGNRKPIPYSSAKKGTDTLLFPNTLREYSNELDIVQKSNEVMEKVNRFHTLMNDLTKWTGDKIEYTRDISELYHTLKAESAMGLVLPNWARNESVREQIEKATILNYQIRNYNTKLRRYFGGVLLKHIIETMDEKIKNKKKPERMELFSAHETTVVALLSALGVYEPHIPEYSSAVIIELQRDRHKKHYIQVLYYLGIPSETKNLPVPNCSVDPCPLEEFIDLMASVAPFDRNSKEGQVSDNSHVIIKQTHTSDKENRHARIYQSCKHNYECYDEAKPNGLYCLNGECADKDLGAGGSGLDFSILLLILGLGLAVFLLGSP